MIEPRNSTRPVRYEDIDALRGFAVLAMILVGYVGDNAYRPSWAQHADWLGYSFADLVYPLFLFVAGLSTAASLQNRGNGSRAAVIRHSFWRSVRLFGVGIFLLSVSYSTPRLNLGTLQCIALISFLTVVLSQLRSSTLWLLVPLLLLLYHLLLQQSPTPYIEGGTLPESIDIALLGKFRAEEGILPTMVLVSLPLFGVLVQRHRAASGMVADRRAFFTAVAVACVGVVQSLFDIHSGAFPILPRLASPASIVYAMSLSFLLFSLTHWLMTTEPGRVVVRFFVPIGRNALALYVFAKLFQKWILNGWSIPSPTGSVSLKVWFVELLSVAGRPVGSFLYTAAILLIVIIVARALDRRGLYWKI